MTEYTCKILMLDKKDGFHIMFGDANNGAVEVYEAIKKTVEEEELPDGLHLTEGLMNNIWLQEKAGQFWSDKVSNFVHADPSKGTDQDFKFIIGEDGKLEISPHARM